MAKIFISYRRSDSRLVTNRIYDRLAAAFGKRNVFKDVDNIPPGRDFRGVLREATANCKVMLVIIGPGWLNARDSAGNNRLNDPNDFVRLEVETGLQRDGTLVIPVLVEKANPPAANSLPESLKELSYNNAFSVGDDPQFHRDMDSLIAHIREQLTGRKRTRIDWRWIVGAIFILMIFILIIAALIQNPSFFGIGDNDTPTPPPPTTAIAQIAVTDEVTDTATDTPTRTPSNTSSPTATATPTSTPSDTPSATATATDAPPPTATQQFSPAQQTLTAIFEERRSVTETEAARIASTQTQNARATRDARATQAVETQIAGETATQHAVETEVALLLATVETWTPTPTNTPIPPTFTHTPTMTPSPTNTPDPLLQAAFTRVARNADWTDLVGDDGYERDFELPRGGTVTMVLVPAGCFDMGSEDGDDDELPIHEICFDEPFWIGKYEVTNEQYGGASTNDSCSNFSSEPDQPRNCVDWFDARRFCEAREARLPTEAEWEYAARGPDSLVFPWGNEWNSNNVNWADTSPNETFVVGSFPQGVSWVGALDLSGNLWEWTSSLKEDYPYDARDGREDTEYRSSVRAVRGGSFYNTSDRLRAANRIDLGPYDGRNFVGFRCARDYTP